MRKTFNILTLAAVLLAISVPAFSQVQPVFTTLSAAVANERDATIVVTSATGFTASTQQIDYGVFIDHEFMRITAVTGTRIAVQRGQANTNATPHASGAHAFVGVYPNQQGPGTGQSGSPFAQSRFVGSCTRGNYAILPYIQVDANATGGQAMYNCLGGQWLKQDLPDDVSTIALNDVCNIPIGSVAYASVGTNSTDIADKSMRTSIWIPQTMIVTGFQVLQGGTATTDNFTFALFDGSGKRIASSTAAGVLAATASTFKNLPFALNRIAGTQTLTLITGPARYWVGVTGNGTAAGFYQTVPTATFKNVLSDAATAQTFGTFPDFVPVATFTADLAPVVCAY